MICWFPRLTAFLIVAPILMGFVGTLLPAFGYLPAIGGTTLTLAPWGALFATPGLDAAMFLSLWIGTATTLFTFTLVIFFSASWSGTRLGGAITRFLSPLVSVPPVAMAAGIAFLLGPSGWIFRALSPWATGFTAPPDFLLPQDRWGFSMIGGLMVKEVPFLFLMTLAAVGQEETKRAFQVGRSLGYGRMIAWIKIVLPAIYPQIRWPLYALLAYSASVVDVAMILGPTTPPPLSALVTRWFFDPDLSLRFVAAAAALLQSILVLSLILVWYAGERMVALFAGAWLRRGGRGAGGAIAAALAAGGMMAAIAVAVFGAGAMILWSVSTTWRFPNLTPTKLTLGNWAAGGAMLGNAIANTVLVAGASTSIALLLAIGLLEHAARRGGASSRGLAFFIYLPLLVPQIGFLFGIQMLLIRLGFDGTWVALLWTHLLYVLPYVILALAGPYRRLDPRYAQIALSLGASQARALWRIKLPILLRPVLVAAALGFSVSAGQYLPTLFAGAGRISTLITESVGLATSGDRRLLGVATVWQLVLPLLAFTIAAFIPAIVFRHRRALRPL
ncbi:MAG: spermidine/putrescine transporter permease [Rhodospirillales bacterium]|nr:spermidine/putrescine transporter permease [Rhodospirillales bacterium]